jgi:hypothetical protein
MFPILGVLNRTLHEPVYMSTHIAITKPTEQVNVHLAIQQGRLTFHESSMRLGLLLIVHVEGRRKYDRPADLGSRCAPVTRGRDATHARLAY